MVQQNAARKAVTTEDCRRAMAEGRLADALRILEELQASGADGVDFFHYFGVALHLLGRSREALTYFEQALALDDTQAGIQQNAAIAFFSAGQIEAAADAAAKAVALRPDNVGGYINLVLAEIKLRRFREAAETINRGLAIAPGNPALLTQAGHLMIEVGKYEDAARYLDKAIALAPETLEAHYNRGVLFQALGRDVDAITAYDAVLKLQPTHQGAFMNKGVSLRNQGRIGEAIRHFRFGLATWPEWDVLKYNIAISALFKGAWTESWPDYELREAVAGSLDKTTRPKSLRWDGQPIADKTLLVIHEQGFGDTFQFIRYLPFAAARAGRVVFACPRRLYPVLSRFSLFRDGGISLVADDGTLPDHDTHIPLMSLLGLSGATPENVPSGIMAFEMEADRRAKWAEFAVGSSSPRKPFRVGLSWQGNPNAPVDKGRSIPLAAMQSLSALSDRVRFISIQRYFGLDQPSPHGLAIASPGADFDAGDDAFVDTAALMMSLDLVITSDTAVAHLAGLLGRPVWLFLKKVPDWRWGQEGLVTPWYPSMRLYRQRDFDDWQSLFGEAANDLLALTGPEKMPPADIMKQVPRAIQNHVEGKYQLAASVYQQARMVKPADGQLLNLNAMAILEGERRSRSAARIALPLAAQSVAVAPAVADFWSNYAVLLDSLGSREDSKRALRFGLQANPDHGPSIVSLSKKLSADGDGEKALATLSVLQKAQPDAPHLLSALSTVYSDLRRFKDAERAIRRAIVSDPRNAKLWVQLGAALSADERPKEAAQAWRKALILDANNPDAFSNLGVYERNHGEVELSCYLQRRAVECDPHHAEGWNNLGIAELEAARDDEAIAAFKRAIAVRPDYADAHLALGMALLNGGNFADGFREYEWRLLSDKLGISANRPNLPYWRGGDPAGKSFLLLAEQGFGDAFQFARYAQWLKERGAAKVLIGCRKRIAHLLATIPGVDSVAPDGEKVPRVDFLVYMMSMPAMTGMTVETIPGYNSYVTADPVRVTRWAEWLARKPGFRVGVVWQGNPDPKVDKGRSFPLETLEPLARIEGVRLIALQKGAGEEQLQALGGRFEVESPGSDYDSGPDAFADTAALMMNLDLIVTSDTAVAHLAGALGKPCWVILKAHPEWRWLSGRSDSPWYPSSRLFRRVVDEVEDRPFAGVMGRVADALARLKDGDLSQRHVQAVPQGIAVRPFDPVKTFNGALDAQRRGDTKQAIVNYARVLRFAKLRGGALHMLGAMELQKDNDNLAVIFFREAERAGISSPEFLTNYSIGLRRIGQLEDAIARLKSVLDATPTAEAHLSLGNIYRDETRFAEAETHYRASIAIKPDLSKAHRGLGNLMRDMHRPAESLAAFERARALDPKDSDLILDHAHAKLFAGDFVGGFRDYEARWQSKEVKPRTFEAPRWDGTAIPDKVLLVHGEQGFGDNIQFVRFVDGAAQRAGHVIFEVRGPLVSLFKTLVTSTPIEVVEAGVFKGQYDFEVPLISLPAIFGTTIDTVPPPAAFDIDPARVEHWRSQFNGTGLKAGLVWQGNPKARADAGRSPPLSALMPLLDLPGFRFISLQKTDGLDQVKALPADKKILVPGEALGDFHETAAAIKALDVVVSSCTSTLHLAATLGVPVLGMLKYHADWRWLNERSDSPYYPTLKLFRQKAPNDWASVVKPLVAELKRMTAPNER